VTLGPERSGLLTLGANLARLSRPDAASVTRRGLWVYGVLACQPTLAFPEDQTPSEGFVAPLDASERELAELRAEDPRCQACHTQFDPYGVVLDAFDAIGSYRTADQKGVPTDAPVTLPAAIGGPTVSGPAELGSALAAGDVFVGCLARSFLHDALTVVAAPLPTDGCEVTEVVSAFQAGNDATFAGLARTIALSPSLRERTRAP
jgi:hypothetical protein